MKYFMVEEEFIQACPRRAEIDSGGIHSEYSHECSEAFYITLGYNVYELGVDGCTENVEFYKVKTDMATMQNNADEVLAQIKQDYPVSKWQNKNW